MKLRNRITGDIIVGKCFTEILETLSKRGDPSVRQSLIDLDLFAKRWEEIHDKKPLIIYDKIREVIRLWTKVNGATELKYYEGENCLEDIFRNEIHFNQVLGLEDAKTYTIAELCGEEEE